MESPASGGGPRAILGGGFASAGVIVW